MNRFIVAKSSRCIGCRTCELACSLAHQDATDGTEFNAQKLRPSLTTVKTGTISMPVTCHHCEDAPCANACPTGAIVYQADSVQVLEDRCIGCKTCVLACPYGAISVSAGPVARRVGGETIPLGIRARAQKCDLCSGRDAGPACVGVCPTSALQLVGADQMTDLLQTRRARAALEMSGEAAV